MANRVYNRYQPIDLEKDVAVGIMLPFGKVNGGLFELSYTTEEQAISNLKSLLLTRKGERPFRPNFGSNIHSMLFENMGGDIEDNLKATIVQDINYWLPYIVVDDIVTNAEYDKNYISISLTFRVTDVGANKEIKIYVDTAGSVVLG